MNRYLLSLATLSTLAVLPLSAPRASGAVSVSAPASVIADVVTDASAALHELSSDVEPVKLTPVKPRGAGHAPPPAVGATSSKTLAAQELPIVAIPIAVLPAQTLPIVELAAGAIAPAAVAALVQPPAPQPASTALAAASRIATAPAASHSSKRSVAALAVATPPVPAAPDAARAVVAAPAASTRADRSSAATPALPAPAATGEAVASLEVPASLESANDAGGSLAATARWGALSAQTTRFGSLGYPESVVATVPGARSVFATPPDIVPLLPVRTPVVLVIGGTPAGVAAAISAARHGASVTLVSGGDDLGGVLTDAMMDQWDFNRAPGGRSIEGGIFPEMYAKLGDSFAPADAARAFAAMVAAEPGIRVIYDAAPVAVRTTPSSGGRRIDGVVVRDANTGRATTLSADAYVDATDDADVVAKAGARFDIGRQDTGIDERTQSVTLMFSMANVDWSTLQSTYTFAGYGPGGATDRRAWGYAKFARGYKPVDGNTVVSDLNFGRLRDGTVTANAVDLCNVNGLSKADRDRAYALARRESYALVAYLRTHLPGFAHARIARFADRLYVRETRHVAGLAKLTTDDIWQGRVPADTIGLSSYPIDLHAVVPTQPPAFATVRHVYGIPFGALTPRGLTNAVMASPSISATHLAAGSARVVPTTVEEGEAAGVAAAISARDGIDLVTIARDPVRVAALRETLVAGGTILDAPPRVAESVATDKAVTTTRTWEFLASPG